MLKLRGPSKEEIKLRDAILQTILNLGGFVDEEAADQIVDLTEHVANHPESKIE